ncbi:hypothetical protein Y1Q_0024449 [Alligator mississippiensis]|uniref:Uncharacterized protein n=1 Tax=Alligator mississippiensis TaxID=8496 RepID=A0A151N7E5_ALLMI|nr:hypothetical protein Y1Q_0024449 [Alligator mississippiensis]
MQWKVGSEIHVPQCLSTPRSDPHSQSSVPPTDAMRDPQKAKVQDIVMQSEQIKTSPPGRFRNNGGPQNENHNGVTDEPMAPRCEIPHRGSNVTCGFIRWVLLSLPRMLQSMVKSLLRFMLSLTYQRSLLLLVGISAGLAAIFFSKGAVKYEAEGPEPLSVLDLLRARARLESQGKMTGELSTCMDLALQEFIEEPAGIQGNAKLVVQCQGTVLEFNAGDEEHEIYVYATNGKPQYSVKGPTPYRARLLARPERLSIENLLKVQNRIRAWEGATEPLSRCFEVALEKFPQEPVSVQASARLVISAAGMELVFLAGKGENEINVHHDNRGIIHYMVKVPGWWPWAARNTLTIALATLPIMLCLIMVLQRSRKCRQNI